VANNGTGTVLLRGNNTYTGGTTLNAGTLNFNSANNFGSGTLTFNGGILQWASGTSTDLSNLPTLFTANGAFLDTNGNNVTLNGNIGGGGPGNLTNVGTAGVLILGPNSNALYTGSTVISSGTVNFSGTNNFGTAGLILNGGTLQWASGTSTDVSAIPVTLNAAGGTFDVNANAVSLANPVGGNGTGGLTLVGNGSLTLSAPSLSQNVTVTTNSTVVPISNPASLGLAVGQLVSGNDIANGTAIAAVNSTAITLSIEAAGNSTGNLSFTGIEYYTGNTTVNSGTLYLASSNILAPATVPVVNVGGNLDLIDDVSQSFSTIAGAGNVDIGSGSTLTVGTNGILSLSPNITDTGALSKVGSGTLNYSGNTTGFGGTTTVNAGVLEILTGGNFTTAGAVNVAAVNGAELVVNGGVLTANASSNLGTGGSVLDLEVTNNGTANFNGGLTTDLGADTNNLIVINSGNLNIGATGLTLGRTGLSNTAQPTTGSTTVGFYVDGGTVSITGPLNVGSNSGSVNSSANARMDAGNLTVAGEVGIGLNNTGRWSDLDVNGGVFISNDTINGVVIGGIDSGNAIFLVRGGTSYVQRIQFGQGANTGSSVLDMTGGNLYLGTGGLVVGTTTTTNTVTLDGGTLGAIGNWSTSLPVALAGTTIQTADENGNPYNITLSGAVSGTNLNLTGTGILRLAANNTFSGTATINSGTLTLGNGGATGSIPAGVSIVDNGFLAFNRTDSGQVIANPISGTGGLKQVGTGTTSITGANNTYTGNTTVNAGTLLVDSVDGTGTGPILVNANGTFGGNGTTQSDISVSTGGSLAPGGGVGVIGNLTVGNGVTGGNLTLAANTNLDFEFANTTSYDEIFLTANFTAAATNFYLFDTTGSTAWNSVGNYSLIQFGGGFTGNLSSFTTPNLPLYLTSNFSLVGNTIVLTIGNFTGANTWGASGSGNWSNPANWDGGVVPNSPNVTALFGTVISSNATVTVNTNITVGGLTLANSVNSYNIGPGTGTFLTLDNGNATPANISAAGTQTVSSPIVLSGNGGFGLTTFAGPNSTLTLSGNISQSAPASLANNGPGTLILAGTNTYSAGTFVNNGTLNFNSTANFGTGTITFNGGIFQWAAGTSSDISTLPTFFASGGAAFDTNGNNVTLAHSIGGNGTGSLTKLGNGILTLSGNNHFSGGAFLNAGTINFNNVNNFGTGTLTFNGGTLQWASGIATDVSAIPVTFAAAGATFDLNSNNVTLANSFGGNGTGGLTVTGNGDLTLAPANLTYSANVTSGNTAISVSNPAGLGLVLGQIVSGNGITSGTTITAVGTNSISLSVAPNTTLTGTSLGFSGTEYYSGNTTINTGTLTLAGNNTLQSFMNVAVNATGNLGLGGNSSQTLATLTGAGNVALAGGSTLTLAPSSSITFSGDLAGTGVINMNGSGTFNFNGTNTNNGTLNVNTGVFELTTGGVMLSSGAVNVANASGARFEVNGGNFATNVTTIINQTSGAGFLEQNGTANFSAGIRTANSAGTFVEVNGGNFFASDVTIRRNSAAPPDFTTGFVVNGGNVNVGTVELGSTDSTGAMTVNGGNVVATGAVTVGWQTSSGRGGGLQVTNGTLDIEDTVNGLVLNRTNSSGIASQNTTVNFFGGTTTLGKLSIGYDNTTTGGLANITLGNATSSGTLYLGSGGIVVNALTSSDGGAFVYGFDLVNGTVGAVSNWSSNATLTLAGNATIQTGDATGDAYNITLNAPLTGTGNWIETGNGTLILTAPNTYAGTTTISSGTLQIDVGGANGTLGSGGILDNGMLAFNRSDSALVVTNNLSGTGGVAQIGTGTTRLEGTNSYTGNTTINAGTLLVDSSDGTGTGNVVVNSGGTLGGNQSVSGSVFVNTGGTIYPGDGGSVGNLSVGSLALAANTIADFAFNGTPANSLLTVATTNGLTLSTLGVSLFAAGTTQPWITPGNYTLIQYTGTNPSVAGLSMLNGQLGLAYNFTASGGNLLVDLTHVNLTGAWNVNASGNWGTGSNWFGTTPNGTAVLAYFPAVITSNQTVTVSGGNFTVGGLVFGDGLASYTIAPGNGSLTLNNGASPANVTVLSGGGTHYISTPLALTTNGANVTVGSGADLNISGNISGHALLTKLGAGSLELAGPNSFSGNVVLAAGTLNLNTGTALGTGALNITGGNLGNSAGIAVTLTNTNSESWNGNFDFVGPNDLNLGLGGIALVGNRTVNLLGANLTTGGSISGTGFGLTVGGNAILTLNGTNTYTGTTTLNGGTLILNNNNALVASGNVNVAGGELSLANSTLSIASFHLTGGTVDTQVAGVPGSGTLTTTTDYDLQSGTVNATLGGTVNLAKNGNGTVNVLTGLAYTGNTTVNSGTLILNNAASATPTNPLPETTLTVGNTGVLVVGGNYGQVNQALTGLVAGGPGADIEGGNTNNSTLSLTIASGTDTYAGVLGLPGNTSSGIAQNALQLNVDGLGTYAPTGNNTYAGGTLIGSQGQATTVLLTGPNELGTGAVQLYAATIDYTANFTANNTINAQSSFGSAGFLEVPANITVTFGANSGLAGSSNLTKTGNGTLILDTSAANSTYSGITVVAAGNLTLGAPNALQDSDLDYNNQGGVFSFGNNTAATLGGLLGAEALALSNATGGALALSVGNDGNDNTYTGNLSGPGSLNKVGTGNFTLTGNNTYTGGTGVNAGTLILASNFTGNVTINNGGTLQSIKHLGNITLDPGGLLMPNLGNGTFGNLTLSSLTWNTNGTAAIQMDLSNTSTPSSDRINIIGNFTKGTNPGGVGQFVFDFQGTGFFYGAPYTLIQFGSNVGFTVNDFAAINLPGSDVANFILTSNALEFSEVPEPPAAALTLAAFALLFVQRRKRKIASELATASAPRTEG
jgi:autotransporter-associated beta strand protein